MTMLPYLDVSVRVDRIRQRIAIEVDQCCIAKRKRGLFVQLSDQLLHRQTEMPTKWTPTRYPCDRTVVAAARRIDPGATMDVGRTAIVMSRVQRTLK